MNRVTATILSVFFPGAGQMSNAQPLKGLAAIALSFISLFVLNIGYEVFPYLFWAVWAACMIDAFVVGKKRDERRERVLISGAVAGGIINVLMYASWAVLSVVISYFSPPESDQSQMARLAEQKLHDRYQQDFAVEVTDANFFEVGKYQMRATQKSDPSVTFQVKIGRDGEDFEDGHISSVLTSQGLPVINKRADEAFAADHLVDVNNYPVLYFEDDIKEKNSSPISYEYMVQTHPDELHQEVHVCLFGTYGQETEQQTMENALRFLQGFSDGEKKHLRLRVEWYDASRKEEVKANPVSTDERWKFYLNIYDGEAPQIKTVEDLKTFKNKL